MAEAYDMEADERKAYVLFAAIGIGYLFPFSANIEFSITVSYMWINLLVLAFLVFVGDKPIFKRSECMMPMHANSATVVHYTNNLT